MQFINLNQIKKTDIQYSPYNWAYFNNVWHSKFINILSADMFDYVYEKVQVDNGFFLKKAFISKSKYAFDIDLDTNKVWYSLCKELTSVKFITHLEEITQKNLKEKSIDISLFCFGQFTNFVPHLDEAVKSLRIVFYLNEYWPNKWGGAFRVLSSNDPNDIHTEVRSKLGNAVIIIKQPDTQTWHDIESISSHAKSNRKVLVLSVY